MGSQIQTFIQMFTSGVGGAILIISAQYWGKRETEPIQTIIAIGLRISLVVGIVFTCIGLTIPRQIIQFFTKDPEVIVEGTIYLRWVCLSFIFFCLTQALISAIATVLSRVTETLVIAYYVFVYDKRLTFRLKHLWLKNRLLTKDFIRYGIPLVAGEIVWSVNMMCNSRILGGQGKSI